MSQLLGNKVKWVNNKNYSPDYNAEELRHFATDDIKEVLRFQKTHPSYTNTPLRNLSNLAEDLNVKDIMVKDESFRFGLNAFKVMGGIYAIAKYLAKKLNRNVADLTFGDLQSSEIREQIGDITFVSATDGNHGRGVAWAARELGQNAAIYMPKGSLPERLNAIKNEGAYGEITDMNYDETVRMCANMAEENDWVMVQDTAWEGYEEIPLWIMQGYASIAHEVVEKIDEQGENAPTHVFLQAGVGSFAAGVASYLIEYYGEKAPEVIVVEPDLADPYYRSFANDNGEMEIVTGDMNTIMAGLACGEPNNRAFKLLSQYASASFSCDDSISALGMRVMGNPLKDDPRIISGESGSTPLGLLYYLRHYNQKQACEDIQLDKDSRVLFINTEGDTDSKHYREIVWNGLYSVE